MQRVLALAREAGTPGAAAARDIVAEHLEALGYRVERQRFAFLPSSLNGFPGLRRRPRRSWPAAAAAAQRRRAARLGRAPGAARRPRAARRGVGRDRARVAAPRSRAREDANLIATRGDAPVRRWIVAHLDTKAQVQSMAGRLVAVWVIGAAIAVLVALALVRLAGPVALPLAALAAGLGVAGGRAGGPRPPAWRFSGGKRQRHRGRRRAGRRRGAGRRCHRHLATGILITGAEEFGLVGARVFVSRARRPPPGDGGGQPRHDRPGGRARAGEPRRPRRRPGPPRGAAAQRASGLPARLRRLPVGILADSLPFARAGMPGRHHRPAHLAHAADDPHARATRPPASRSRRRCGWGARSR